MAMTHVVEGDLLRAFASKHRLKVRLDEDGTHIIPGRAGHIYEYDVDLLGVMVMPPGNQGAKWWGNRRRKLIAAGCTVQQDGDTEGSATFDLDDPAQAKLAIQVSGIKKRRVMSPAQLAVLEAARRKLPLPPPAHRK